MRRQIGTLKLIIRTNSEFTLYTLKWKFLRRGEIAAAFSAKLQFRTESIFCTKEISILSDYKFLSRFDSDRRNNDASPFYETDSAELSATRRVPKLQATLFE